MLKKGDTVICTKDNGGNVKVGDVGYYIGKYPGGKGHFKERYNFPTMKPGLNTGDKNNCFWLGTLGVNVELFEPRDEEVYY